MAIQATWTKVKIIGIFFGRKVPLKVAGESKVLSRIVEDFFQKPSQLKIVNILLKWLIKIKIN